MIGRTLSGRYRVLEEIGRGGMGVVYKAHDERLQILVAVKVLPTANRELASVRMRFLQEGLQLVRLNHPNVVIVRDVGTDAGDDYLVMEYVPGVTLDAKLKTEGALPEAEVLGLGVQLAEGLSAAHGQRLIHRDLKPGNLRLMPDGRLKILDFGLAKQLHEATTIVDSDQLTAPNSRPGTPAYMAPEQILAGNVDERADIYAAGCVLYELATGRHVFAGVSAENLQDNIIHQPPRRPRELAPAISARLEQVILKALAKNPRDRHQTAAELLAALQAVHSPHPPGLAIRVAIALVAIVLAGVIVLWIVSHQPAPSSSATRLAILPLKNLSNDPQQEWFTQGISDELANQLGELDPDHLSVISRTAVMKYKDGKYGLADIGNDLKVAYVLGGSIMKAEDSIRVVVNLDRVSTQSQVWGAHFDESVHNWLSVETKIVERIVRTVSPRLLGSPRSRRHLQADLSTAAQDAYLHGRGALGLRTEDGMRQAIRYFEEVLREDSTYALAHAGLADAHSLRVTYGYEPRELELPLAKAEAQQAIRLDDSIAEGHVALASVLQDYDWDWPGAEREFARAIELNGNYPEAHHWYATLLAYMGRSREAREQLELALGLDPLSSIIKTDLATLDFIQGRVDDAIAGYRSVLREDESFSSARDWLVLALWMKGLRQEAAVECVLRVRLALGDESAKQLEAAVASEGPVGIWRWQLRLEQGSGAQDPFRQARLHGLLGERDLTFDSLDKAYRDRSTNLASLTVDPAFDAIRSDPRYLQLVRRLKLRP